MGFGAFMDPQQLSGWFQFVDLPMNPVPLEGQNPVHILGGILRGHVRTHVAGLKTVANGQHIHTGCGNTGRNTLVTIASPAQGKKRVNCYGFPADPLQQLQDFCGFAKAGVAPFAVGGLVSGAGALASPAPASPRASHRTPLRALLPHTWSNRRSRPQDQR